MSAQAKTSSETASKVNKTKQSIPMMTKRDTSTVMHRRWTETVVATLCVVAQIMVFMLKKWTRSIQNGINRSYGDLVFALSVTIGRLADAVHAIDRNLGIAIGRLLDAIDGLSAVDLKAAISDAVRGLRTGLSGAESVARALMATVAARWQETVDNVLGELSRNEQQERTRLSLENHSLPHDSNARPKILQRKCLSQFIDERTTERQETPEKRDETTMNTPQPTVLRFDELTYDTLPLNAAPISAFRPDKMAKWRREKFLEDVVPTITAEVTDGRHDGSSTTEQRHVEPAKRYGRRAGRYFTMPPAGHSDSRGLAKTRPRARDDMTCKPRVPSSGVPLRPVPPPSPSPGPFVGPPPSGPVSFSHGYPGPFVGPLPPGSVPFSDGYPGPFAGPPPPGPTLFLRGHPGPFDGPPPPGPSPYSYGHSGTFEGPPPLGSVPLSNGHPGPFAAPSPPGTAFFLHGHPGSFNGPPPPGSSPYSYGRPGPFVCSPPPGPAFILHGHPGPFDGPPPPGPSPYSYGHPGMSAGPPPPDPRRFWCRRQGPLAAPSTHSRAHTVTSRQR